MNDMEAFSGKIAARRLAQSYTDPKLARTLGYEDLVRMIQEAVAVSVASNLDEEQEYNEVLKNLESILGSGKGFEEDIVIKFILDLFSKEVMFEGTSVLDVFKHYTYNISKLICYPDNVNGYF